MINENVRPPNVGVVRYSWVQPVLTGFVHKHVVTNVVTDTFKEACARLLAGATDWKPSHIGFMFGAYTDPAARLTLPAATDTMDTVIAALDEISVTPGDRNVLIVPLASVPEVTPGTSTAAIVFNGCSVPAASAELLDPAGRADFVETDRVYDVLLIADTSEGRKLLARAALTGSPTKTAGRELAVYWQITMTTPVPV